jgi:hypothetical protein
MGKTDGRSVKRLWKAMIDAGAVNPDGKPLTTKQVEDLEGQPFRMQALSNHLAKKRHLFIEVDEVRIANADGSGTYPNKRWLALPEAYD